MKINLQHLRNANAFNASVLIITSFLFLCGFSWSAQSQNIIENPSFEAWDGNQPANWFGDKSTLAQSNAMQVMDAKSGSYSLKIINTTATHKRYSSQSYLLDVTKEYELVYYVKGVGQIRNSFYDGETGYGGIAAYSGYQAIDNLNEWTKISYRFQPGKTTTSGQLSVQIIFSVISTDATSGILIDEVSLKHYTSTAVSQRNSNAKIAIYRPNADVIKVTTPTAATSVTVVNATGNSVIIVMTENEDKEITIPVKKITSGVYIVVVKLADGTQVTTKFIK
jgi:hypothetical protein